MPSVAYATCMGNSTHHTAPHAVAQARSRHVLHASACSCLHLFRWPVIRPTPDPCSSTAVVSSRHGQSRRCAAGRRKILCRARAAAVRDSDRIAHRWSHCTYHSVAPPAARGCGSAVTPILTRSARIRRHATACSPTCAQNQLFCFNRQRVLAWPRPRSRTTTTTTLTTS